MLRAVSRARLLPRVAGRSLSGGAPLITSQTAGEDGEVVVLRMDDGKMNAFSFAMIEQTHTALDAAQKSGAGAVVLTGNAKCFSAGFDLQTMGTFPSAEAGRLLRCGAELVERLYSYPRPLVMAAPGHALALGAIVLCCGDVRIGTADTPKVKVGLNEVHIGMPLPQFAFPLLQARLSPRHLPRATTLGNVYSPEGAAKVGFHDVLVPPEKLADAAVEYASKLVHLGKQGDDGAFATTKGFERQATLAAMRPLLEADVATFSSA